MNRELCGAATKNQWEITLLNENSEWKMRQMRLRMASVKAENNRAHAVVPDGNGIQRQFANKTPIWWEFSSSNVHPHKYRRIFVAEALLVCTKHIYLCFIHIFQSSKLFEAVKSVFIVQTRLNAWILMASIINQRIRKLLLFRSQLQFDKLAFSARTATATTTINIEYYVVFVIK